MKKWEYLFSHGMRQLEFGLDNFEFNKLGIIGWELVSVVPIANDHSVGSGSTDELVFIFKRPMLNRSPKK